MKEGKLRLAVVGLGKMGLLHASLLNVFPEVELVALCEKGSLMRRLFKKVLSGKSILVVDDVEKLGELDLNAIYVTTPISSHSPIIKEIYSERIARNVFVEKTLASNFEQSKELCELASCHGDINMVGYMKRFSMVFGKAKELLSHESIGKPEAFKGYAFSSDFLGLTKKSKSSASRGGALSDLGCHVIDLAHWMFGPFEVQDISSVTKNEAGTETSISFTANATGSSGLTGQFEISQAMPGYRMPEFGLSINCSEGKIDVNDDRLILTQNTGSQTKWHRHNLNDGVGFSIGDPEYFREDAEFINSILSQRQCESSFDSASFVDYLIDSVRARSNRQ